MTVSGDYYEVLGVPRDADAKTIKNAFRQLARRYHPDTSTEPDAERRFKEIAEACGVLSDPAKRASYDAQGSAGLAGATAEDLWGGIDFADIFGSGAPAFGGLFERLFGPAAAAARPGRAPGPGHLPGGGADRRDTASHDPLPRPVPAVRRPRILGPAPPRAAARAAAGPASGPQPAATAR
jgi:molecular chaperone DnaJ